MHKKNRGARLTWGGPKVAQTIEGFVGKSLDEAKISPLHMKIVGLIAAGYFFDVIDFTILGSLNPFMTKSFATPAEFGFIGSAAIFGMAIGTAGQGQLSDRFGRRFIYQFNLLLFGVFTILGALAPSFWPLVICRFIAGLGLGAEQPLAFAYAGEYAPKAIRGRILAIVHFIGGAMVWPIGTLLVLLFGSQFASPDYVWRGIWLLIGIGALIVWVFRFTLPESPRYLATHGRGDEAIAVLKRLGIDGPTEPLSKDTASDTKSDPFAVVFKMFPRRVIAGMICFTAFFGFAIGVGAWLPNIYMVEKGFTVTKSLTYVLAMNCAVPCASIFMMYALDNFGRKITSVCAFIAAGVMVIVFANATSDMALLAAGFVMVFFVQVAGNAMQIFTSEVFPTNARASGFGWSSGVGRVATAFIIPGIQLIRGTYGIETVFVLIAIMLVIAAVAVTQLGPEAKRAGLDEIAPPTDRLVEAGQAFWLKFIGFGLIGLSIVWWIDFFLAVKEIRTGLPCFVYTTSACSAIDTSKLIGHLAYQPYLLWIGIIVLVVAFALSSKRSTSTSEAAAG
jgi:MFS transporter, putative metabolite:H+ symporter